MMASWRWCCTPNMARRIPYTYVLGARRSAFTFARLFRPFPGCLSPPHVFSPQVASLRSPDGKKRQQSAAQQAANAAAAKATEKKAKSQVCPPLPELALASSPWAGKSHTPPFVPVLLGL
jgi:hypothetical protein